MTNIFKTANSDLKDLSSMKTGRLVTVYTSQEASLIQGNLKNHGIPSFTTNDTITTLLPYLNNTVGSGIHIYVDENDIESAAGIISPILSSVLACPNCGSENVRNGSGNLKNKIAVFFLFIISTLTFSPLQTKYRCLDCSFEFKK